MIIIDVSSNEVIFRMTILVHESVHFEHVCKQRGQREEL